MSTLEITGDVIPEELLDLMARLSDEWWGEGHCEDGLSLDAVVTDQGYALLTLAIAAYEYLAAPQDDSAKSVFRLAIKELEDIAVRGACATV